MLCLPSANGPPGFDLHPVVLQEFLGVDLLMKWMGFNLVDHRHNRIVYDQIHDAIRVEVAHTDGAYPTLSIQVFHRSPCAVNIAKGSMNQK